MTEQQINDLVNAITKNVLTRLQPSRGEVTSPLPQGICTNDPETCKDCGHCISKRTGAVKEFVDAGVARISSAPNIPQIPAGMSLLIDHTLLKPTATPEDISKLCQEAKQFGFATVCINPTYVKLAKEQLQGTPVKVCTVVGFPLGATTTTSKVCETLQAVVDGADEIDMVINIGLLKAGRVKEVEEDIRAVAQACQGRVLKVIIETALLSDEEKVTASILAKAAGADFVKTSTGFASGGATAKDVALMRKAVGPEMGVKASGGIRDLATAEQMVQAGATRLGTSASIAIVKGK
jgi:deoxyribose-phosphate aldolase